VAGIVNVLIWNNDNYFPVSFSRASHNCI